MSREELARRLAAADQARAKLRQATREMRELGEHVLKERQSGSYGSDGGRTTDR